MAIVASPATKHLEIALLLAKQGVHLLIEKPIAATSKGVKELIDICYNSDTVLMTAYNLRFSPSLIEFQKQVHQQTVGTLLSIRAEVGQYLPSWRPDSDYRKTVSARQSLGGGVLLELSHEIDYLSWIFGSFKWVKSHVSRQSKLEIDVEDSANIIFGIDALERDLIGTLNMDFIRQDTKRQCFAIGEKGTLCWDGIKQEVKCLNQGSKDWELIVSADADRNYTYTQEINFFFDCVENKRPPVISGADGLETVMVVDAIRRSSDSNSIVYI